MLNIYIFEHMFSHENWHRRAKLIMNLPRNKVEMETSALVQQYRYFCLEQLKVDFNCKKSTKTKLLKANTTVLIVFKTLPTTAYI